MDELLDEERTAADTHEGGGGGSDSDDESGSRSSASSSSEEDLLSDEEEENQALLHNLEASLAQNPYSFQEHVEYIRALRKAGMLEKLREARETMSSIFPLSPEMWQEWTSDEARIILSEEVASVIQLFERGLQDYLSVPLWLDYLEFNLHHDQDVVQCNDTGVARMRALFERALGAASLHFTEGTKIWAAYRQFETNLLSNKQDLPEETRTKQVNCIRNIYRRQLSVPSWDLTMTLKEYINWELQQGVQIGDESDDFAGLPTNIATAYKKAVQMCSLREPLEGKISKGKPKDAELLQNLLSYIALEEEDGDPARMQVLYERAVVDFPITHDLWLKYTSYLEKNLKGSASILSVYGRATKNCPWNQVMWSRYLLALERFNANESDIANVFEQSLHSGFPFSTPEEYLDLFLTRVDGLRRRIVRGQLEKSSYLGTLRETFSQALEILSTLFPTFIDQSLKLHTYWARLEYSLANDMTAARGVWENCIKSSGWMLEVWKGYILMEVTLGNLTEARTIFKRCYTRKFEGNGTEALCEAWLQFEREYGALDDYDRALMKVMPRLAEIKKLQQQQDAKLLAAASMESIESEPKSTKKVVASSLGHKKRHLQDGDTTKEPKSRKRHKALTEGAVMEAAKESSQIGIPEVSVAAVTSKEELERHQKHLDTNEKQWYSDQCTAYVSRLPPMVTEEDLREVFDLCNSLREIRLMRDRSTGASRGFAYVDFDSEDGLNAALKLDNHKVKGSKIKVARSNPALTGKKAPFKHTIGLQGPHSSVQDEVVGHAGPDAAAHDNKSNNAGRGHDEKSGQRVEGEAGEQVRKKQQSDYGRGRGRGKGMGERSSALPVSHRRGGHVQLTGRNTFAVPRSLARPLGFSQRGKVEETASDEPKSNDDFRKMLSKKRVED